MTNLVICPKWKECEDDDCMAGRIPHPKDPLECDGFGSCPACVPCDKEGNIEVKYGTAN